MSNALRTLTRALTVAALAGAFTFSALAQAPRPAPTGDRLSKLNELAQIMGAAHYIRTTCEGVSQQFWRTRMQRMMELEAAGSKTIRAQLVENFNTGFDTERQGFDTCDAGARAAEEDLRARGKRITDALAAPNRAQ
jgi:uncharacterized protein (TIGR02301 family)